MQGVTVIIPAYKPENPFVSLVAQLAGDFSVLVVDDGSGDDYADYFKQAKSLGAQIITHPENRGKGAAIKTAIAHLQNSGDKWVAVTVDADGQHCPDDIRKVARLAVENPDSLVLGVRDIKQMPLRSRFGNSVTRFCFLLATHKRISDTQTGLRGFSYLTADRLASAEGNRYEYEMNVLLNLKNWRIPSIETTIQTIYIDDNSSSHFHPVRDSLIVFGQVLKHTAASLLCTLIDYLMYLALLQWTPLQVEWAYLLPRVITITLNYQLSRRIVFHSKPDWRTVAAYYSLAICSMSVGTILVKLLCGLGAQEAIIKFPVDTALFFANFFVQKYIIFKDQD